MAITFLDPATAAVPYAPALRAGASLEGAIQSAERRHHYAQEEDLCRLAAAILVAVTESHALIDGNKRASIRLAEAFLAENSHRLEDDEDELVALTWDAAAGDDDEDRTAERLRALCRPGRPPAPLDERLPRVMERLAV
jgi:death-on-curing family protein